MKPEELIAELRNQKFLNDQDKVSPWIERKIEDHLRKRIVDATDFLADDSTPLKYRIFFLLNDIVEQPRCRVCSTPVSFDKGKKIFQEFCSIECVGKSGDTKEKRKNTNLERFGVTSNLSALPKEERVANAKKAYKAAVTSLQNTHGVSNPMHLEGVKKRHKERMNQREVIEKRSISLKAACLEKHGVDHFSQKNITNFERYKDRDFILENFVEDEKFLFQKFLDFFNIEFSTGHNKKVELEIEYPNVNDWKYGEKQQELFDFVRSIYPSGKIIQNSRSFIAPLELDIVIPEYKLAIEFDGTYWHSNLEDRNYHKKKTESCEKIGYQLFHIFENEWNDPVKRDIWKSMISNKLQLNNKTKIGARNCEIRDEVSSKEASEFLNRNHLQGNGVSSIRIGLYHGGELVSLMTFVKSRFDKTFDFELSRFCNKTFCSIPGAFSRLLNRFEVLYGGNQKLVSYGNRRWTSIDSNVYKSNAGDFLGISDPNYFYIKGSRLHSRIEFQKHKLEEVLKEGYDPNLSERQNVINNGYRVIYDSGNLKYQLLS